MLVFNIYPTTALPLQSTMEAFLPSTTFELLQIKIMAKLHHSIYHYYKAESLGSSNYLKNTSKLQRFKALRQEVNSGLDAGPTFKIWKFDYPHEFYLRTCTGKDRLRIYHYNYKSQ